MFTALCQRAHPLKTFVSRVLKTVKKSSLAEKFVSKVTRQPRYNISLAFIVRIYHDARSPECQPEISYYFIDWTLLFVRRGLSPLCTFFDLVPTEWWLILKIKLFYSFKTQQKRTTINTPVWLHVSVFSRQSFGPYFPVEVIVCTHYTLWDPIQFTWCALKTVIKDF